jgi:hypothetical protein
VTGAQESIESAIGELERLHKALRKKKTKQIRSDDERQIIKATAHTWFNTHRKPISLVLSNDELAGADKHYKQLLGAGGRAAKRSRCLDGVSSTKKLLAQLQADHAITLAAHPFPETGATADTPPDFSALAGDARMQAILTKRWQECVTCVDAPAPLAATVMMGGMLEGLLLARINQLHDKSAVFKANSAPKDKARTPLKLNEWGLKNFIDVAHELGWITTTTKDVGEVVRDYRNYIHPHKEYSHGIDISSDDSRMLWEVAKNVARQVLRPAKSEGERLHLTKGEKP